ncbi:TPA: hypothetical protein ACGQ50_000807 [Enterobacter cloacae]
MAVNAERPITVKGDGRLEEKVTTHPAFGMVTVNRQHTNRATLHASDLNHQELVNLAIYEGKVVEHDGVTRYTTTRNVPLVEITMSPAQWAAMITSFGMGEGVPCTLNYKRDGKAVRLPEIEPVESTRQRFDRMIEESARRQLEKMHVVLEQVSALAAKGKAGKKELAELERTMSITLGNLPLNLAYTSTIIQEQMDGIVSAGKAELEATALGVAARLGLKEISRLAALENREDD